MTSRYITCMVCPKDNLGQFDHIAPLSRLQRRNRSHWNRDQNEWERMQAKRIAPDLAAFMDQRYRGIRIQVFAEVCLILGALCATKAGFSHADVQEFVEAEQAKQSVRNSPLGYISSNKVNAAPICSACSDGRADSPNQYPV